MWIFLFILVPAAVLAVMLYYYNKQERAWQKEVEQYQDTALLDPNQAASEIAPNENEDEENENEENDFDSTPSNHTAAHDENAIYAHILPQPQSVMGFRQPERQRSNRSEAQPYTALESHKEEKTNPEQPQNFQPKQTISDSTDPISPQAAHLNDENDEDEQAWDAPHHFQEVAHDMPSESDDNPPTPTETPPEPEPPVQAAQPTRAITFELVEPPRRDVITFEETVRNLRHPLRPQLETVKLNTSSRLSIPKAKRPAPNLEIITLETALRDWQNVEDSIAALPEPIKPQPQAELLATFSSVRERTLQRDDLLSNKYKAPSDAETIGMDDIRDSLMRQRRARHHQTIAEAPIHSTILHVIPENEVMANLARTDSPINRRTKTKRSAPLNEASLITVQAAPTKKHDDDLYRVPPTEDMLMRFAKQRQQLSLAHPVAVAEPAFVPDMHFAAPQIMENYGDFQSYHLPQAFSGSLNHDHNDPDEEWGNQDPAAYPISTSYPLPSTQLLLPPIQSRSRTIRRTTAGKRHFD